ncbi:hypothetical protein OROGR_028264 [Orobanche gracilis]
MVSTNRESNHVMVEDKSSVRIVTLNRPNQLNALSSAMGKGRAFCAGADVAEVVHHINRGSYDYNPASSRITKRDWKSGADISRKELTMNYVMATYSKPQVSILNGIVMGGGAGASIHGRFRIATENTLFAMPETALGLFPDVGASYFLSRLPGFFGEYVGLTGARLDGVEMLRLPLLEEALVKADSGDSDSSAYHMLDIINKVFSRRTIEEIIAALEREAADGKVVWISYALDSLKKASPMSLKISLRSIREGRLQGIGKCLVREFRMLSHAMRGEVCKDFAEGCRAILLDKDQNPKRGSPPK